MGCDVGPAKRTLKEGHQATILSLAFSPDRQLLASGDKDGVVAVWEVPSGKRRFQFTGQRGAMRELLFSPDGAMLIGGGCGYPITFPQPDCGRGAIYLWNVVSGKRDRRVSAREVRIRLEPGLQSGKRQ